MKVLGQEQEEEVMGEMMRMVMVMMVMLMVDDGISPCYSH